jgi:hypothetical protein
MTTRDREQKLSQAIESGLLFIVPQVLEADLKSNIIVVHANHLLLAGSHGVAFLRGVVSPVIRQLLTVFQEGKKSKAELLEQVWRRSSDRYDPEIDDPLVFSNLSRLRKIFGSQADVLRSDEQGYWLNCQVVLPEDRRPTEIANTETRAPTRKLRGLNWRQTEGYYLIRQKKYISVSQYGRLLAVSLATARRDLVDLKKRGIVDSQGRGRATTYCVF